MMRRWIWATVALLLALAAQNRLAHEAPPLAIATVFLVAIGLAIGHFPHWGAVSSPPTDTPAPVGDGWVQNFFLTDTNSVQRIRRPLLMAALLMQGGVLALVVMGKGWPWDWLLWSVSLLAFLVTLIDRDWWQNLHPFSRKEALALVAVLALALLVRVYHLGQIPNAVHGDEAESGLNARLILRGEQTSFFDTGWYHLPVGSFVAQAGVMYLFGDNIFGLRLSSALFGALTLLPVYLLTRSMFDRRVALASAALMGIGHWSVHFSRLGINYIQATFFAAWGVYLAWRGLRMGHRLDYALTGLALGLGLYTYYGARLMPFVVGFMLPAAIGLALWRHRSHGQPFPNLPQHATGLLALALAGALTVAPQALFFSGHPEQMVSRQRGVFLFTNLPHLEDVYKTDDWGQILRRQVIKSLLVFNAQGDSSAQYGFEEPMLDQLTAGLMIIGMGLSLWRWRRGGHWILHLWFWPHVLLGSALTIDAPFVPRLSAMMPVPFIWAGVALGGWWRLGLEIEQTSRFGTREFLPAGLRNVSRAFRVPWFSILAAALLILTAWSNYDAYVNRYLRQSRAALSSSDAARLVASLPPETEVYLMGAPNIYARFGTIRFLAPDRRVWDAVNVTDWVPVREPDPPDIVFLLWYSHLDRLPYLEHIYPEGDYQPHLDQNGNLLFATYSVSSQAIRQKQGLTAHIYPADQWTGEPLALISPAPIDSTLLKEHLNRSVGSTTATYVVWSGTLWLPDDRPRLLCVPALAPPSGSESFSSPLSAAPNTFLQVRDTKVEIPRAVADCNGLFLRLDLPAGPHPIQAAARLGARIDAAKLYWRQYGGEWEAVTPHDLWIDAWPGGLLGSYAPEGGMPTQDIVPLIAYRELRHHLNDPLQANWAGCLRTEIPDEYEFRVRSFDGARLIVDSRVLIQDGHRGKLEEATARIGMDNGDHFVRLEALFGEAPRWLEWYWRPPGSEWQLVPPQVLLPPGGSCQVQDAGSTP